MFTESGKYKATRSVSMTSKIKSMFKRQISQPDVGTTMENNDETGQIMRDIKKIPVELVRQSRYEKSETFDFRDDSKNPIKVVLRRKNGVRRHNTSLGAIEDLLQCPICKDRLQSPRMMPCQHTFCEKCLDKQSKRSTIDKAVASLTCPLCDLTVSDGVPEQLPTNLYIESLLRLMENPGEGLVRMATVNTAVSFAALPPKTTDSEVSKSPVRSPDSPGRCFKCSVICDRNNRCKHCKQIFCVTCWIVHADELKNQLEKMVDQLKTTSNSLTNKIQDFRTRVNEARNSIDKNIEARMEELSREREDRMKTLTCRVERGEESAGEVQRRLNRLAEELRQQRNVSYDAMNDHNAKVNVFVSLYREATELIQLESSWNPDVGEIDRPVADSKQGQIDLVTMRGDIDLFYRRRVFNSKLLVNRDTVQRPCGMAHDPWRDHVFVACPGSRQIVVLDRKYKVFNRYHNVEMMAPQGLAYLESTEELFVTDKWKHCIFVFNRKGELVRQMCKKGQGESQLSCPEGLAIQASRNLLYVADTGNDRIQILELNGNCRGYIGPTERLASGVTKTGKIHSIVVNHLNQPTDVAVTDDVVIVADCGNHKVKIFNREGLLVHSIGGSGTQRRFFRSPEVVKLDSKGNIVVGDSGNARVQIFSAQGDLLRLMGGRNSKTNKFGRISGLLIKNNFDMIIADSKNNTIKLF